MLFAIVVITTRWREEVRRRRIHIEYVVVKVMHVGHLPISAVFVHTDLYLGSV